MPDITLLDSKGRVHDTAGLNWGANLGNHTTPIDAYIPISKADIVSNPGLFDVKGLLQIEITLYWDDGVVMTVLFEGNSVGEYPKQIASTPHKNTLGAYFRSRIGVANNVKITMQHLKDYGRTKVTLDRIDATSYNVDFS